MIRIPLLPVVPLLVAVLSTLSAAEDRYGPSDPIAAIDGDPIFLGELNLILTERLGAVDLDKIGIDVKQATAALVVRRHLALKSLQLQGGPSLDAIVQRQIESFAQEASRRGSSLEQQAKQRQADEQSLIADITWRTTWSQYLKSRLTDSNLRRFFEREQTRYAGGRWRVSQIFIDMDPKDEASVAVAEQRMTKLAQQLRSSDSIANAFAEAVREYSDAGSASEGGELGWVEADGDLPTSVMNAVRQTGVGKVSDPVRSPLGMHLVFVQQFEQGKLTFDDLTDQSQLRRDAANALFDALIRQQAGAKVVWFIGPLRPPATIPIVPL